MKKEIKLELNGKDYNLPYGLGFIGECLENLELNVFEIGQKLDDNVFKWVPMLIFESHKYQCYLDDVEPDFTYKQLLVWLDDDEKGMEKIGKFLAAFVKSLTKDVPKEPNKKIKKAVKNEPVKK